MSRLPRGAIFPRWRIVCPAPAEHGRHDLNLRELFRVELEWIPVEDDEVGETAGEKLAAAALVARQPDRVDRRCQERFLEGETLFRVPVPQHGCADSGQGVELLDGCVGPVG